MESPTSTIQLELLKNRLALRTFASASLAKQLETANLAEKPAITIRWEDSLKDCYALQFAIELLERKEREIRTPEAAGANRPALFGGSALPAFEVQ
jgi:hypothetical protein